MKLIEFTRLLLLLFLVVPMGCREEPTLSASGTSEADNSPAGTSTPEAAVTLNRDGYQPVFDADHAQNTISNRMQNNFANFKGKLDPSEFTYLKSAGLKIYRPDNLPLAEKFTGFLNPEKGVSFLVLTNPFSMEKTTSQLVADAVRNGNSTITYTKELDVDGREGVFYLVREPLSDSELAKCIVAFGDEEFSWILTGTFKPEMEGEFGEGILKTMLNIKIAEEGRSPPGLDVDFTMDPGRLRITDGFIDKVVYTLTGKFPTELTTKEPVFQAGKALINFNVTNKRQLAAKLISPTPAFRIDLVSSQKEISIDGLDGFEFVSIGTDTLSEMPLIIYTVVLFDGQEGYVMHGWASSENETNYVPDFRGLAESFKRR